MTLNQQPQSDFNPLFEIVSCFIVSHAKMLLLHRQVSKPQPLTWGVPAGKVEVGEDLRTAMQREIQEETGIPISTDELSFFSTVYVRYPDYDFTYHIFTTELPESPKVRLNPREHLAFKWVTPESALGMNLIQDLDACIRLVFKS